MKQESNNSTVSSLQAKQLWKVIHRAIRDYWDESSQTIDEREDIIRKLLNSLSRSIGDTAWILTANAADEDNQLLFDQESGAFLVWIFGELFRLIDTQLHESEIETSMEIQAYLLGTLSKDMDKFNKIASEYLLILQDLVEFEVSKTTDSDAVTITRFVAEEDAIAEIKLTTSSIVLTEEKIPFAQKLILRIILKTGVSQYNEETLLRLLQNILKNAEPNLKMLALELYIHMIADHKVQPQKFETLLAWTLNILAEIPYWASQGLLQKDLLQNKDLGLIRLVNSINGPGASRLCLEVIKLIVNDVIVSTELEAAACQGINRYLKQHPTRIQDSEIAECFQYCLKSSKFLNAIIANYVLNDTKGVSDRNEIISVIEVSHLWQRIIDLLIDYISSQNFEKSLEIFKSTAQLSLELGPNVRFYGDLLNGIINTLTGHVNSDDANSLMACNNLIELMAHEEVDKKQIQTILISHLTKRKSVVPEMSLNTKIKCIEVLCKHGFMRSRLSFLDSCIVDDEEELAAAVVSNCVYLMKGADRISLKDVTNRILNIAKATNKEKIHVAIANTIGLIACELSAVRGSSCSDCDFKLAAVKYISPADEELLKPYFELLTSPFDTVRLQMLRNFCRFSNHLKFFNDTSTAKIWLEYMSDVHDDLCNESSTMMAVVLENKMNSSRRNNLSNTPTELESFTELLKEKIEMTFNKAMECGEKSSLLFTLLETLKKLYSKSNNLREYGLEKIILSCFIVSALHCNASTHARGFAIDYYNDFAKMQNISPNELYIRYRKHFLRLIMEQVVYRYICDSKENMTEILSRLVFNLLFKGIGHFITKEGHIAICYLMPLIIKFPDAKPLLDEVINTAALDTKETLKYFQHLCSHVMCNEPPEVGTACLTMFAETTKSPMEDMWANFEGIMYELILRFHENPKNVLECLNFILDAEKNPNEHLSWEQKIADTMKTHILATLVYLEDSLAPKHDEDTQKSALSSLSVFINFMGAEYLSSFKFKILATLRISLNFNRADFRKLSCKAWYTFIKNMPIKDLAPLLPMIFISTVPLQESCPNEINEMLEFLVIKHNKDTNKDLSQVFFLDDLNVSEKIANVIRECIKRDAPKDISKELELWLNRISHETHEVRLKALIYLRKFLDSHRSELNEMILGDKGMHPLITQLLNSLLAGCKDKNEKISFASGECIGRLGAIEPSLLPRQIVSRDDSQFYFGLNENFGFEFLNKLVSFSQKQTSAKMDSYFLAIQEILKFYGIQPNGRNSALWKKLSAETQKILDPLLRSHYFSAAFVAQELPHPIFGSEVVTTFDTWVYNWCCSMINSISDESLKVMLRSCSPLFNLNFQAMTYCIPHLVSHLIVNGTDVDRKKILEEMTAVINIKEQPKLSNRVVKDMPLREKYNPITSRVPDETRRVLCSQIIFATLDHLNRWLREHRLNRDMNYHRMKQFCMQLDDLLIAEGCYQSSEYHRALMYLEQYMTKTKKGLSEPTEADLLTKIYISLKDPDGVSGILMKQDKPPTLHQLITTHEVNGQFQDAAVGYERLIQTGNLKPEYIQGMINCYYGLNQPFAAIKFTEGVFNERPEFERLVIDEEPFWKLAHCTRLDTTQTPQAITRQSILNDLKNSVKPDLRPLKKSLVSILGAMWSPAAYQQTYPETTKLHVLDEFEKVVDVIITDITQLPKILEEWEKRWQLVKASSEVEFVLSMRRATLDLAMQYQQEVNNVDDLTLKEEIGKMWLKSAKIARKAGLLQQAYLYILSATDFCSPQELFIEQAQHYWQKGCQEEAFTTLDRGLSNFFTPTPDQKKEPPTEEKQLCAKAKLLYAKYNDETLNVDTETNLKNYRAAVNAWKVWEKSYVACAQYYETTLSKLTAEEKMNKDGMMLQRYIIHFYGNSLKHGCKYVHQSLPRLLTMWLDCGSKKLPNADPQIYEKLINLMCGDIEKLQPCLSKFIWLTAFSQLVSRICHQSKRVQALLKDIIVDLIAEYPQHCLWMLASVYNSSLPARKNCCRDMFNHDKLKTNNIPLLIQDFNKLWEQLINLSDKPIIPASAKTSKVSSLCKELPRLLQFKQFSSIMMPTTIFRQLHLPNRGSSTVNHRPFVSDFDSIRGIEDQIVVMPSLQKPRRITLIGSSGKNYVFMCKPKDDLRRDFRLMEFNDVVNKYLQKDPESRQRRLYIRTYSVVPLNEESGLIEWVPNLVGFRPTLMNLYQEQNQNISSKQLKALNCASVIDKKEKLEVKKEIFVKKLLPLHPPVLSEWFRLMFTDPYGWYEARTAYIRTTAVMSMVGFILGLGDRHGENILFDRKSGDTVHVDFNCLFNRGTTFDVPERVPFRLTHNMTEAMGPLKYEGPYRRACQVTMRVLREQANTLISVLTPFVYDPLVTWQNKNQQKSQANSEWTNEKAVEHIKNIDLRLKGSVFSATGDKKHLFSVEGQVNYLILDATNIDNLCQMYIGWGPYL